MKRQAADGDGVSHEEGPSNAKKHLYSLDDMDRIGDRLKLKDKQMRDLRTELNKNHQGRVVEPGLSSHLVEQKQVLKAKIKQNILFWEFFIGGWAVLETLD